MTVGGVAETEALDAFALASSGIVEVTRPARALLLYYHDGIRNGKSRALDVYCFARIGTLVLGLDILTNQLADAVVAGRPAFGWNVAPVQSPYNFRGWDADGRTCYY